MGRAVVLRSGRTWDSNWRYDESVKVGRAGPGEVEADDVDVLVSRKSFAGSSLVENSLTCAPPIASGGTPQARNTAGQNNVK